jgi:putative hemolysin
VTIHRTELPSIRMSPTFVPRIACSVRDPMSTSFCISNISSAPVFAAGLPIAHSAFALNLVHGRYELRLAQTEAERIAAYRLRFQVFNLELHEGLDTAYETEQDIDEFDAVCDHLIVEDRLGGRIVGTYRLQTGPTAAANVGYYGEREFDFRPYEQLRGCMVELGRACIHREHRSTEVLFLLWRGIVQYAVHHAARYLIGCCSLTSQDAAEGTSVFAALSGFLAETRLRTDPKAEFTMPLVRVAEREPHIPKLLRTYLAVGAKICGPPAIDREFKTIDFLTLMDLDQLHARLRSRFLNR